MSVSRLCEGLVQLGVELRVITTNAGLPDFPVEKLGRSQLVNGVNVTYYPVDRCAGTIQSQALVAALPEQMAWAEVVHLSSIWQPLGLSVQWAAYAAGIPVIQTLRGALGPYSWRRGWWKKIPYFLLKERPLLQRAAALHCTTDQEVREISWLRLKAPVKVLANPIALSQLHSDSAVGKAWREQMSLPTDQPLLLVAGRLHHKKGLDLLPEVLNALAHMPWQIIFLGDDDDGTGRNLRRKFGDLGLASRCHWHPALPARELISPYNAADWLLLPSRHENFGNVVIEALACGSGSLISDRVGVAGSLRGSPGVLVAERSKHAWVQLLERALRSPRPGLGAEEWVKERFSTQLIAREALQLYAAVLNHG
ncbi:glycosyltransferase [Synechococcus sp. A10-1-5-1]|uniref:glycosyltransferase n=1 Tax=Synechococcus sp. A10-1-5-1 TaxID=2936507 RepID=UPI002001958A|nr:glycosyltransferase [Synechococcus sp. A10-1-5-1]